MSSHGRFTLHNCYPEAVLHYTAIPASPPPQNTTFAIRGMHCRLWFECPMVCSPCIHIFSLPHSSLSSQLHSVLVAMSSLAHMYNHCLAGPGGLGSQSALVCVRTSVSMLDRLRDTMAPLLCALARSTGGASGTRRALPAAAGSQAHEDPRHAHGSSTNRLESPESQLASLMSAQAAHQRSGGAHVYWRRPV